MADAAEEEELAQEEAVELVEEGGLLPPIEIDEEEGGEVVVDVEPQEIDDQGFPATPTEEDYDDDLPPPPPPPPPLPEKDNGRKKKMAIAAGVGLLACIGLGLGLGFGLTSNNNENKNSDASNASGRGGVGSEGTETAASTTATEAATTEAPPDVTWDMGEETSPDVAWQMGETTEATEAATATTATTTMELMTTTASSAFSDTPPITTKATTTTTTTTTTTEAATTVAPTAPAAPETYDAVIIGAGWAGIRATETLIDAGITNILVLEAADYIGGRAKSMNLDDSINDPELFGDASNVPFDLGCEWLYNTGSEQEEVLEARGYLTAALNNDKYTAIPLDVGQIYQKKKDGSVEILEDQNEWMEEIWWDGFLGFRDNRLDELEGLSYAEAIDRFIDRGNWNDDESLQFLNLMEDVISTEYTADSEQFNVEEVEFFTKDYSIKTHYMAIPGMGFGNIAANYAEPLKEKIQLNSKVTEILTEMENGGYTITVKYEEDGASKSVIAETVLVTVSLGVLKAGNINFVPSLPSWKQESIDNMGFGLVNKCVMTWDNDDDLVWPRNKLWFLLMTPEDETSGEWTTFYNPSKFKGKPSLTAWAGGDDAVKAEAQSDEEILNTVMNNLRSMFPEIRDPDRVIISRWGQEENVRGTYSFPVPGRDFCEDADNLQLKVGRIYFAGEATGSGWATTMGAWETGEEQALNMAEYLGGN